MKPLINNSQTIKYYKKSGVITDKEVIIDNGKRQDKIYIESISRVNLIKKRVFYSNIILLAFSFLCVFVLFFEESKNLISKIFLIILAISTLTFAIIHKFYFYKIEIKLKNNESFKIKTSQFNRDSIKEFYSSILKRVKKDKKELFNAHSA